MRQRNTIIVLYLTSCFGLVISFLIFSGERKFLAVLFGTNVRIPKDDDLVANHLKQNVRVLCWIMTSPKNLLTKAVHVKNTWGRRCTKLLFMSSKQNDTLPAVGLNVSEGRGHLTAKTMEAFRYIYDHHLNDADWFMKADDDTYVILENLRYFLSDKNSQETVFYGHYLHPRTLTTKNGYFSGGAGYVLSKAALKKLAAFGSNKTLCRQDGGNEDLELGICMENLNVTRGDSTDSLGRRRFHAFSANAFLHGVPIPKGFSNYERVSKLKTGSLSFPVSDCVSVDTNMTWYPTEYDLPPKIYKFLGMAAISDYAISFHYITPQLMYDMEFFVYHLRPYGLVSHPKDIKVPI